MIPVPEWVKEAVDSWTLRAALMRVPLLRSINKAGRIWGHGFTPKVIWAIVKVTRKAVVCQQSHRTTCDVPVHGCAIRQEASWNFCSHIWARRIVFVSVSEAEFQRQLNLPGVARGRQMAEPGVSEHRSRIPILRTRLCEEEIGVVENIEELSPELQIRSFSNRDKLEQREVPDAATGAGDGIASHIAKGPRLRIGERAGVEESPRNTGRSIGIPNLVGAL